MWNSRITQGNALNDMLASLCTNIKRGPICKIFWFEYIFSLIYYCSSRSNGGSSGSSPVAADTASPQPAEPEPPPEPAEPPQAPPVELHPRKRKLKSSREVTEPSEPAISASPVHPHDQPITNCYQLFLNIRKQVIIFTHLLSEMSYIHLKRKLKQKQHHQMTHEEWKGRTSREF